MRRSAALILAFGLALIIGVERDANAVPCPLTSCYFPNLKFTLGSRILPTSLPRREAVPVTASIFADVKTADGTHPSALRELVIDVDKDIRVNAKGYPVCESRPHYDVRNPEAALKACGDAILSKGSAHFEIAFPEQDPITVTSPITVFNGGEKGGKVTLYIHVFITVPAPAAIATTVTISRKGSGIHSVAKIPVVAGGSGSLLDFNFKLGKTYSYKGKRVGYFEAKCPDGNFKVNVAKALFKNEAQTPGVAPTTSLKGGLVVPCTPKG